MNRMRSSLLGATALNMVSNVSSIVIALALSPFIVSQIGLRAFGYWSAVLAVMQYVQIADGGLPAITMRHVAEAASRAEPMVARRALATSLLTASAVACCLGLVIALVALLLPAGVGRSLPTGWRPASALAAGGVSITIVAMALSAVARGHGRWDLDSLVQGTAQVVGAVVTVVLLLLGLGMLALGIAAITSAAILLIGYVLIAMSFRALGGAGFRPHGATFRDLRRQGVAIQVVALVSATASQADRLMLLPFTNLSFIGAYSLGSRAAVSLRQLPLSSLNPLMARFAAGDDGNGPGGVKALYRRVLRVMALFVVPALLAVYFAAYPAVLAWLGSKFTISAMGAVVLGTGYALNLNTGPGTSLAIGSGKAELDRDYNVLGLAINVVLSALFGVLFGPWGVIVATSVGLAASSVWLIARVDDTFMIGDHWRTFSSSETILTYAGVVLIGLATIWVTTSLSPLGRVENLALALGSATLGLAWVGRSVLRAGSIEGAKAELGFASMVRKSRPANCGANLAPVGTDGAGPHLPVLALVSVTYNSEAVLPKFLDAVEKQDYPDLRTYVVDNDSRDTTRALVSSRSLPSLRLIQNPDNRGFARASNQGIRHAIRDGADAVVLINNDTKFEPDFFRKLVAQLPDYEQACVLAPHIVVPAGTGTRVWYAGGRIRRFGLLPAHDYSCTSDADKSVRPVQYASGCCLLITAATVERIGLLDEDFFVYCEDVDYCLRLSAAGVPLLYAPEVVLWHDANALTGGSDSAFTVWQRTQNQVYVIRKHSSPLWFVVNLICFQTWILARIVLGRESARHLWRRERALARGLRRVPNRDAG